MIRSVPTHREGFSFPMRMGSTQATTSQQINAGLNAAATTVALAVPVVGPIIGGAVAAAGALIQAFGIGNGCGGTCTASTEVVNQVIPMMQRNLLNAQQQAATNGGCLTPDEQSTCIAVFSQLWQTIVQQCGQIGGPGGHNCIADRQRGGKYDCFVTLLDPISDIPVCAGVQSSSGLTPSEIAATGVLVGSPGSTTSSAPLNSNTLLYAGLGLAALFVFSSR